MNASHAKGTPFLNGKGIERERSKTSLSIQKQWREKYFLCNEM